MNNHLRQLRVQYSLTQEVLAEMLGVSRQTIISIESGRFNPSLELAFKISNIFKVPIEQFIGDVDEAVQHAFAIPDFSIAAHLAEQYILRMIGGSRIATYLSWVRRIPDRVIYEHSYLCAGTGWAYALSWQPDTAQRYVQAGEAALSHFEPIYSVPEGRQIDQTEVIGHLTAIRAHCARIRGDFSQSIAYCRQALNQLPHEAYAVRCIASLVLGQLYLEQNELALAYNALTDAFEVACQSGDNPYAAVAAESLLGDIVAIQGNLQEADRRFQQALEIGAQQKGSRFPIPAVCMTYAGLAAVHYQRNELASSAENLSQGLALAKLTSNREVLVEILLLQARLAMIMGNFIRAKKLVDEAGDFVQYQSPALWVALRGELYLAQGNVAAAARWMEAYGITFSGDTSQEMPKAHYREYLVLARILLAQQRFAEAVTLLDRLSIHAVSNQDKILYLETTILQATAGHLQANNGPALDYFKRALSEAEPEGFVRVFLDAGAPVMNLLRQAVEEDIAVSYAEMLLEHFKQERTRSEMLLFSSSKPLLSERECQVLDLLADKLNYKEIADRLMISVSTVRSHIKNIQRKLSADNQEQVIATAKRLGLL